MTRTLTVSFLIALFSLPLAAADDPLAGFTPGDKADLAKDDVVVKGEVYTAPDGKRSGRGKAYVVINKPPPAAFAVLRDYGKVPEFLPRVRKVSILKQDANTMKVRQEIAVPFPVNSIGYTLDLVFLPDANRMDWTLDKSADNGIADTFGSWEFLPYEGNKTLVRYTIAVATGRFVPSFLEDYLMKKDLPGVLSAMKKRVESGGTWKKD